MKDNIKLFKEKVENLENKYSILDKSDNEATASMKESVLELLASLKHHQDEPENEAHEEYFEDLIYRVIIILGEL